MCGIPCAVRRMVTVTASALEGSTSSAKPAAVSTRHPLTAPKGIGGLSLGAPVAPQLPCRAVHDPISYFQAVILGLTQGIAEPFPISSLGHGVIMPRLFGWDIHQNDKFFLTFLVATHLATAIGLFFFFLKDWVRILSGLGRSLRDREIRDDDARLGWLLGVGTIPAGILGLLPEHKLGSVFGAAATAAAFLIFTGVLLLIFERLRRRPPRPGDYLGDADARIAKVSWRQAIAVGTAQAAA